MSIYNKQEITTNTKVLLLIALPLAMTYAASSFAGKEEKVEWSQVPATVQKTITENSGGGKVEEIEKERETKNGKSITVYEAKVKKPRKLPHLVDKQ